MSETLAYEDENLRIWVEDQPGGGRTQRYEYKPGSPYALAAATSAALDDRIDQALAGLRAYRDAASPTTAQTVAVVKVLCRAVIALIRRQRSLFDGAD